MVGKPLDLANFEEISFHSNVFIREKQLESIEKIKYLLELMTYLIYSPNLVKTDYPFVEHTIF